MARNTQNTQNDLAAQLEALQAELAQAKAEAEQARAEAEQAKASRKRGPRMTPKQRRFLVYLAEHPEADIATACREAGATETSHGFVFRMIENGYLRVSVVETPADSGDDSGEPEGDSGESEGTEDSTESTESETAPAA